MNLSDNEFRLNKGGKYLIRITDEEDTVGIFRGYSPLGQGTAVTIEMSEGRIRFIPVGQITFIDVLDAGEEEIPPVRTRDDVNYG